MCVAVPGRIVAIGEPRPGEVPGTVDFGGRSRSVNLVMVPDARVGDRVVTHSGFAIRVLAPETGESP